MFIYLFRTQGFTTIQKIRAFHGVQVADAFSKPPSGRAQRDDEI
jgi:hypothetical protein